MIIGKNISKVFVTSHPTLLHPLAKQATLAVDHVSVTVKDGEITGLLGLNGAGKTTTIKMLSGVLSPNTGTITMDGKNIEENLHAFQQDISIISGSERGLFWHLDAADNLRYFGRLYGLSESKLNKRIPQLLDLVGLEDSSKKIEAYSKGMKQRLQFARGLINDPKYIFLDEPTLGLDVKIALELRDFIRYLAKTLNKGVLLTTHYLNEAAELCNNVYVIKSGKIVMNKSSNQLIEEAKDQQKMNITFLHPHTKEIIDSLRSSPLIKSVASIDRNTIQVSGNKSSHKLLSYILNNQEVLNLQIIQLKSEEPSIEKLLLHKIQ